MRVYVFITFHRKGFSWLNMNKTINVMPEVQASNVMLGEIFLRQVPLSVKPREVKDSTNKLSKNQR